MALIVKQWQPRRRGILLNLRGFHIGDCEEILGYNTAKSDGSQPTFLRTVSPRGQSVSKIGNSVSKQKSRIYILEDRTLLFIEEFQ